MIRGRDLEYPAGKVTARGYLAVPDGAPARGAVVLFPEAPGVGPHGKARADALAGLGIAALAADPHGGGRLAGGPPEARSWVEGLKAEPAELVARLQGAYEALVAHSGVSNGNVAAAGYCFGGWCALELARTGTPMRSVTVFHGALASERGADRISGSVLVCTGGADPFVPAGQIAAFTEEMALAGADYQLCLYGGVGHGFTDPNGPKMPGFGYDPKADSRAWQSFLALLAEHTPA